MAIKNNNPELSIILPCRNEEQAIDFCITQIKQTIKKHKLKAEIIISDSSCDSSPKIARSHKVKLVKHDKQGYGIAYLEAFKKAKGKYLFLADCDGTYDFNEIPKFLKAMQKGYDFVIGDRFKGNIEKNAMPWHHKKIGNPILSGTLRLFFKTKVHDIHCGMRAISRQALEKLDLKTTGMEFASEMVVQALKNNLKIKEIPINYHKRKGNSKLRSFTDAWRHMRFMLLYSPLFLFFIPGLILFLIGLGLTAWLYFGSPQVLGIQLFYHPMFFTALLAIIGYQLIIFSVFAKTYAITHLNEKSNLFDKLYKFITIEKASIIGFIVVLVGIIIYITIFGGWISSGFSSLNQAKNSIIALTLIILGVQTIFSSFMLSILGIKGKN